MLMPSTIASQMSTGSFVSTSQKNGNANSSVNTAPAM